MIIVTDERIKPLERATAAIKKLRKEHDNISTSLETDCSTITVKAIMKFYEDKS